MCIGSDAAATRDGKTVRTEPGADASWRSVGNCRPGGATTSVRVFEIPGMAIFDRGKDYVYRAGTENVAVSDDKLRDVARQGAGFCDDSTNTSGFPLRLGGDAVGSLAIRGSSISDAALRAICNLAAIAMEKALAEEAASRIEAVRQNEALKATLLDALAHEFMTPADID